MVNHSMQFVRHTVKLSKIKLKILLSLKDTEKTIDGLKSIPGEYYHSDIRIACLNLYKEGFVNKVSKRPSGNRKKLIHYSINDNGLRVLQNYDDLYIDDYKLHMLFFTQICYNRFNLNQ